MGVTPTSWWQGIKGFAQAASLPATCVVNATHVLLWTKCPSSLDNTKCGSTPRKTHRRAAQGSDGQSVLAKNPEDLRDLVGQTLHLQRTIRCRRRSIGSLESSNSSRKKKEQQTQPQAQRTLATTSSTPLRRQGGSSIPGLPGWSRPSKRGTSNTPSVLAKKRHEHSSTSTPSVPREMLLVHSPNEQLQQNKRSKEPRERLNGRKCLRRAPEGLPDGQGTARSRAEEAGRLQGEAHTGRPETIGPV